MNKEDRDAKIRTFIIGSLVEHSGKQLLPELIGQLTAEILTRIQDVLNYDENS